ncbi:hypothetical protein Nther_1981 [Natranaerobius thermophilus JW/NM-WN-LF]|uniref:Uncharacterized protein n=2 Tax=Natranaerobius TaxID=375928 RepID=B2A6L7_NATTJ|nr:hypothetical protein Nther_1981 [Natranaerobius thermophilus JW/NM-WN-LF]
MVTTFPLDGIKIDLKGFLENIPSDIKTGLAFFTLVLIALIFGNFPLWTWMVYGGNLFVFANIFIIRYFIMKKK